MSNINECVGQVVNFLTQQLLVEVDKAKTKTQDLLEEMKYAKETSVSVSQYQNELICGLG
jgi:hypothetical protein